MGPLSYSPKGKYPFTVPSRGSGGVFASTHCPQGWLALDIKPASDGDTCHLTVCALSREVGISGRQAICPASRLHGMCSFLAPF